MAITKDDVVTIAPELASVSAGTFTAFIADAEVVQDFAIFDEAVRDVARKWFVAHLMVFAGHGTGGGRGDVTSETVGSVSRAYASPSAAASPGGLASTRYGRFFLGIKRALRSPFWVVP